ncbi:hypothetical protein RB653_009208 [Dictyostelium firmibasis]|uniref:EGF-like domain-containing protein n=1 Tax=Dictyostelium firmibasis TaxID=79012 RepID=A0AAN7TTW7_9MYCE
MDFTTMKLKSYYALCTVGWKFNITDDLNGFESGYIKVMVTEDSSKYEFNFTINNVIGDKFNCQYQILINISEPCYFSSTGCNCYVPWIGLTCTSQIIIVPQPTINTTNPQTEIPTTPTDNNQTKVNIYIFDQWIYTPINQFKNQYFTTISSTNITVTLEWFNQTTSIEFVNQNLTMNPSTINYTIEITNYPFVNKLNQLQLVMSASLTLNSNEICSSNQFGNTSTGDDSNYLKIQIENHSLYGRFIIVQSLITLLKVLIMFY